MKYLLVLLLSLPLSSNAQVNYVLNPSFEQYTHCPTDLNQIEYANHWNSIDSSWIPGTTPYGGPLCLPDYCNSCSSFGNASIPNSEYYYQYPRTGNGMGLMCLLLDTALNPGVPDVRDYVQGRLSATLSVGKNYCVTFYVNVAEASGYAIDKIGAYLDDGAIDIGQDSAGCARPQTAFTPQIYTTSIIMDTLNWVKIQGSFTAAGTEKFITIGNYFSYANTNKVAVNYSSNSSARISYYLLDDLSVIESDAVAKAGGDKLVSPGSDSAFIGTTDEGMPCTWYVQGDTIPIGYSGGLKVHPDVTTSYVVEMDLCGNVTRDTVVVYVAPAGVNPIGFRKQEAKLSPNPATSLLTIACSYPVTNVSITNLLGQTVLSNYYHNDTVQVDVANLPAGVYLVRINGTEVRKFVKQ